jgi:hypothetical protein
VERFNFRIPKPSMDEQGKKIKVALRRTVGRPNRRIISCKVIDNVEYSYHATKGWRKKRLEGFNPKTATVS